MQELCLCFVEMQLQNIKKYIYNGNVAKGSQAHKY